MNTKQYFYITFIQADKNNKGYIVAEAYNKQDVEKYASEHYTNRVSSIYPEDLFSGNEVNYPDGILDEISLIKN